MSSSLHFIAPTDLTKINKAGVIYLSGNAVTVPDSWRLLLDVALHKLELQHRELAEGSWTTHSDLVLTNFDIILIGEDGNVVSDEAGNIITSGC